MARLALKVRYFLEQGITFPHPTVKEKVFTFTTVGATPLYGIPNWDTGKKQFKYVCFIGDKVCRTVEV